MTRSGLGAIRLETARPRSAHPVTCAARARRNHRPVLSYLLGCLVLIATVLLWTSDAAAEEFRSDEHGFSITPPEDWRRETDSDPADETLVRFSSSKPVRTRGAMRQTFRPTIWVRRLRNATDLARIRANADGKDPRQVRDAFLSWLMGEEREFRTYSADQVPLGTRSAGRTEVTWVRDAGTERASEMVTLGWTFVANREMWGLFADLPSPVDADLRKAVEAAAATFRVDASRPPERKPPARPPTKRPRNDQPPGDQELSEEETRSRRAAATVSTLAEMQERLGSGWTQVESDHYTAVSARGRQRTREVLDEVEQVRAWLDRHFGFLGSVQGGRTILVLFEDGAAMREFERSWVADHRRTDEPGRTVPTLFVHSVSGWVDRRHRAEVWEAWLRERNQAFAKRAPAWFDLGLREVLKAAEFKSGRAKLGKNALQPVAGSHGASRAPVEASRFFDLERSEIAHDHVMERQCGRFVHFLLEGAASRSKRTAGRLARYLKQWIVFLAEEDDRRAANPRGWKPLPEAEALATVRERTFSDWEDADWKSFDAGWRKARR